MKERLRKPLKNWIKAFVWSLIYTLFIVWVGNFWWLFLLLLIFDMFITGFIPWTFWKKTKNKYLYTLFSWIDAILFALIAVYFINTYLFQNYKIPSSSLEKTLLVGDHLFVSKASYGPRIPNTPLSLPLMQHTIPMLDCKSYIEKPQWEYRRLKGWRTVKRNDIVVFNFPAGDTVAFKMQNPDYYTLCYYYGRNAVHKQTRQFGEIVYRPVDRRENYVKRCVAVAGDTLQISDNHIFINGIRQDDIAGVQYNYFVQTTGIRLGRDFFEKYGISEDDRVFLDLKKEGSGRLLELGLNADLPTYHFPMTYEVLTKIGSLSYIKTVQVEPEWFGGDVFPLGASAGWTRDNYGPIYIPKKGDIIALTPENMTLYRRIIENYEGNRLEERNGNLFINDEPANHYTFKMDYFWMMGDNRHKSSDSRYWGFVPEDHIVGRPVLIWLSLDKDKGWFEGKIRWRRFFKNAEK